MSEPASADPTPQEPATDLPAPYINPWFEFGRNLQAIAADARLRLQELWRRNRDGDLSVPGFWPRDLTPAFWPLLLLLLLLLPLGIWRFWSGAVVVPDPVPDLVDSRPADPAGLPEPRLIPAPAAPQPDPLPVLPEAERAAPALTLDPLLELFLDGSAPDGLLASANPMPEQDRLVLVLTPQWFKLAADQRNALAADWLQRAHDLDYGTLQLVDDKDQILARSARAGGGMILFDLDSLG